MPSFCLTCSVKKEDIDIITAIAYDHETTGTMEEELTDELSKLKLYFTHKSLAEKTLLFLKDSYFVSDCEIGYIEDQDWNAKWRESLKPVEVAPGFWVSPAWLEPPVKNRSAWVKIEPKMAFGTGHHESTKLASEAIINNKELIDGKRLLDIGTGSGVLCFFADICGSAFTLGVEIDKTCRENLSENKRVNQSLGMINFLVATIDALCKIPQFDIVTMNMLYIESVPLIKDIRSIIKKGGHLIWSGLLFSERTEIISIASDYGFKLAGELKENEWWCGTFELK
ncbi:50S ribosomal protein L11 methyltransferase [Chitinispirillales bacterium ANBcel5]|uniref:50S ribosomal protein L11 methyltransferase n=1 Tax=Cellulosispirillum alkaliphilum TaxID=3039283 RepID=UPI002A54E765|nr:50S ribosomal protein L11 methyltransferase [Chitinispirillales bacterium ANBcel5]